MAILVRQTWNLKILPQGNLPKIKMATILLIFEEGTLKLVYNPKLYMLLGVYVKQCHKAFSRPKKLGLTNAPPHMSELAQTQAYGGGTFFSIVSKKIYILLRFL